MATVPEVDRQIEEVTSTGFKHVVLDLAGLTFLDSTGLRLLIKWTQQCAQDGISFSVLPGGPQVARVLEISGVGPELTFADRNNIRGG
jgi:anti-sigma B factor antagonist